MEYIRMEKPKGCFLCDKPMKTTMKAIFPVPREVEFRRMNITRIIRDILLVGTLPPIDALEKLPKTRTLRAQ